VWHWAFECNVERLARAARTQGRLPPIYCCCWQRTPTLTPWMSTHGANGRALLLSIVELEHVWHLPRGMQQEMINDSRFEKVSS